MNYPIAAIACLIPALAASAQPGTPQAAPITGPNQVGPALTVGEPLVIGKVAVSRRELLSPDAVAGAIVAGNWRPPTAGETVKLPDGSTQAWQSTAFGAQSTIRDDALASGYAEVPIDAAADEVVVVDASGHSLMYVNGEPRTGDPYGTGWARLPVKLHKGRNDLLFRGGRGGDLRVQVRLPMGQVYIDAVETTLPDVVEGRPGRMLGAVIIVNATDQWQRGWFLRAAIKGGNSIPTPIDPLPPLSVRKAGFGFEVPAGVSGKQVYLNTSVAMSANPYDNALNSAVLPLRVRAPFESRKVTFRSEIDGSVQYYALRPAVSEDGKAENAATGLPLIFTLHGASVEAIGQADAYQSKPWANIVAPTNRRPYGFDWEDWGRLDAVEVLDQAISTLKPDERRLYLTGHSMGGHGTWQLGAHFAPRFAAIAPSAGWVSFRSYTGAPASDSGTAIDEILRRAASPSDTLALKDNYGSLGVYILHGDLDDNVPVEQAREMRKVLGGFHPDFAYYERPGAGHWWGNQCVDWPPLMEFIERHTQPAPRELRRVRFTTATPGISSAAPIAAIWEQSEQLKPSTIDLNVEPAKRLFSGATTNISVLVLDPSKLSAPAANPGDPNAAATVALAPDQPISIELDGQKLSDVPWPSGPLFLERRDGSWRVTEVKSDWIANHKGPQRAGLFKSAFNHNVVLVAGTGGTPEENAWALAKARSDSETFWYRGNGSLPVVLDTDFDPAKDIDRSVILYGNATTNKAWAPLLDSSPVNIKEGQVVVGDHRLSGADLAGLIIRPRPGSRIATVGAISGTGAVGMRAASRVPIFLSGVGIPDWVIFGPESCEKGTAGIRACGFFGNDWGLSPADSAWAEASQNIPAK